MLIAGIVQDILETAQAFLFGILLFLDAMIYSLINWVYQIILILCNADLLKNSFEIDNIVGRIYIILGVVILFLVAYSLLKAMVNPDEALKGKKSPITIIKDVIISVVLVALIPTIFEFAMGFQTALLTQNTIGSLILGSSTTVGSSENIITTGGITISTGVLEAFLHPDYSKCDKVDLSDDYPNGYNCDKLTFKVSSLSTGNGEITFNAFWEQMKLDQNLFAITDLKDNVVGSGELTYYFLISTIAGIFVLFVFIQYCFDISVRAVKLAVYELIAPLPILARILPNEQGGKVFSNWLKATISTYVEVFIRLAILFFAVLLIKIVIQNFPSMFILFEGQAGIIVALFAQMFIVVGVILFVKQAPEIIKEITGLDGGKYGKSLMKGIGMMTATLGGGATAMIRTAVNDKDNHGFKKGFNAFKAGMGAGARGLWHGNKVEKFGDMPKAAGKAASNTLEKRAKVKAAGGNGAYLKQWIDDKGKDFEAWKSGGFEAQQKMLDTINAITQNADAVKSKTEGFVRDKKYIFKYGEDKTYGEKEVQYEEEVDKLDENGNIMTDENGKVIKEVVKKTKTIPRAKFNANTSLAEMEAMIQTLKSTGDIEDAKVAAEIDSDMNKRIKKIGQELSKVAAGGSAKDFGRDWVVTDKDTGEIKFNIESEAAVEISEANSQFELMKKRVDEMPSISSFQHIKDAQKANKIADNLSDISIDQSSDLSKALKSSAAEIQQEITLEQERRKAKEKK